MVHTPGTEDEYGSCWGFGGAFWRPYCGYLPDGKGSNRMYRWYVANPVRFQTSLKVEIQDIRDFGPGADDFTSVAFWYQEEPHQAFALQPFAERIAPSRRGKQSSHCPIVISKTEPVAQTGNNDQFHRVSAVAVLCGV